MAKDKLYTVVVLQFFSIYVEPMRHLVISTPTFLHRSVVVLQEWSWSQCSLLFEQVFHNACHLFFMDLSIISLKSL